LNILARARGGRHEQRVRLRPPPLSGPHHPAGDERQGPPA